MKNFFGIAAACLTLTACGNGLQNSNLAEKPSSTLAVEIGFGSYTLYRDKNAQPGNETCEVAVDLNIINSSTGGALRMANKILGSCEIHMEPSPREYLLTKSEDIGCGSKKYTGVAVEHSAGLPVVELIDHRSRICRDYQPHVLIVSEKTIDGVEMQSWHHVVNLKIGGDFNERICLAYWEGYDIGQENTCLKIGTSGCSNPFRFTTLEACKSFYRL